MEKVLSSGIGPIRFSVFEPPAIPLSFSKRSGAMIGLEVDGRPLLRAYSMAALIMKKN